MICICNEKHIFNKREYYLPIKYSMEYKRYSIETNKIINELIYEMIEEITKNKNLNETTEIKDNYFSYQEEFNQEINQENQEDNEYVSIKYFKTFLNLGNYLNTFN